MIVLLSKIDFYAAGCELRTKIDANIMLLFGGEIIKLSDKSTANLTNCKASNFLS